MGKKYFYKDLGEGYQLKYREKANGCGGYHSVDMELLKNDVSIKKITNKDGYFLDFPGVVDGAWKEKLIGSYEPYIDYVSNVSEFMNGFALFSWMVQPDGRYYEDETGFGADYEDEVMLYAYMNKNGEFVTPFADFHPKYKLESFEAFKERTGSFMWNSLPHGFELWVSESVKHKVGRYGEYKSFFGNTIVFPLEKEKCEKVNLIQMKLDEIRKDFEWNQREAYLADALNMNTYHITIHDLFYGTSEEEVAKDIKKYEKNIFYIIDQVRKMDFPKIKVEPVCMYNLNSTSIVLGFEAASIEDHNNLMMLYELFQPIVQLKDYTPHMTLGYFRYGRHKEGKLWKLKELIWNVNEFIRQMKMQGIDMTIELDVNRMIYQYFTSMNCYLNREMG